MSFGSVVFFFLASPPFSWLSSLFFHPLPEVWARLGRLLVRLLIFLWRPCGGWLSAATGSFKTLHRRHVAARGAVIIERQGVRIFLYFFFHPFVLIPCSFYLPPGRILFSDLNSFLIQRSVFVSNRFFNIRFHSVRRPRSFLQYFLPYCFILNNDNVCCAHTFPDRERESLPFVFASLSLNIWHSHFLPHFSNTFIHNLLAHFFFSPLSS